MPLAERHLQEWVQQAGEEEVHAAARKAIGWEPLSFYKRQPLTTEHYLQKKDPEQLKKQWLEQQLQKRENKKVAIEAAEEKGNREC